MGIVFGDNSVKRSDTDLSDASFFLDEDNMISNDDTKVASQQSIVSYVNTQITASNYYQGGYNAATNTPDLESPAPGTIFAGYAWDVTVAGTFFTEAVEVNDSLRAAVDDPASLADWVISQTNLTPESIKVQYESNPDTNAFTDAEKSNLANQSGINTGDETTVSIQTKRPLKTVEGQTLEGAGNIDLTKADVGLDQVDNTSDLNKPISTATQTALDGKVNKVASTNNAIVRFDGTSGDIQNSPNNVVINDSGFLGLNVASPSALLHLGVPSSGDINDRIRMSRNGNRLIGIGPEATPSLLLGNGSVGINTTNPEKELEIRIADANDGLALTYPAFKVGGGFRETPGVLFRSGGSAGERAVPVGKISGYDAFNGGGFIGGLLFYTQLSNALVERMRIDENGNVGIGTTAPEGTVDIDRGQDAQVDWSAGSLPYGTEKADLILTREHGVTKDSGLGYAGNLIDFRIENSIGNIWSAAQITSSADPNGSAGFTGGLQFLTSPGGSTDPVGKRDTGSAPVVRMSIDNTGRVGIGTTLPAYELDLVGNAGKTTGTAWINTSDERLKTISGEYKKGLAEVLKLKPILFRYKDTPELGLTSKNEQTGFSAQEVQKVIPEAITEGDDGYLRLDVDPIHWATVNAVKDLSEQNESLKQELSGLKSTISHLIERIEVLEALNAI